MKILLLSNLFPPYVRGGAEKIAAITAQALSDQGHQVKVISTEPYFAQEELPTLTFPVFRLRSWYWQISRIPVFLRLFWHVWDMIDLRAYWKIRKIVQTDRPDLVITHNLKGLGYLIPWLCRQNQLPQIHVLHDIQLLHPSGLMFFKEEDKILAAPAKAYAYLNAKLFASPAAIISPSRWLAGLHLDRGFFPRSIRVIMPNPVEINPGQEKKTKKDGEYCFLFVGQIEPHKGLMLLLNAFHSLKKKISPRLKLKLEIVGAGSDLEIAKIIAQGDEEIKFWGKLNPEQVRERMLAADCLVVPSLCYENSPTVIYEAAAAALPVIASRLGGIPELADKFGGWLFAPGDKADLAAKMLAACEDGIEAKTNEAAFKEIKAENYTAELLQLAEYLLQVMPKGR